MTQNRTLYGMALMVVFCALAPLLDTCAKLATASIPVGQITAARFVVQAAVMIPVAMVMRLGWRLTPRALGLLVLRAVLLITSTYCFVAATAVMAVFLGYVVFGDFPNALTWAGISVIVGSGLYVIYCERMTQRPNFATSRQDSATAE